MAIDITLRQVGLERKTMPLKVILGADLLYGAYDEGWRLHCGEKEDEGFLAYMPMQIARGITVDWNEEETEKIRLRVLTPTAPLELRAFYELIHRISTHWNCELEVDGNLTDIDDFIEGFPAALALNEAGLNKMAKDVLDGVDSDITFFSAMWPLVMGRYEAEAFLTEPTYFSKWLHEKQNIDAYYSKPAFYRSDDGVLGRYAISEQMRCIIPVRPYVPYGFDDPETGELIECEDFGVLLYCVEDDESLGELTYDEFIKAIKKLGGTKVKRYDGNHMIIEGLTKEELKSLTEKC